MTKTNALSQGEGLEIFVDGAWAEFAQIIGSPELADNSDKVETTHSKSSSRTYMDGYASPPSQLTWTANAMPAEAPNSNTALLMRLKRRKEYMFRKTSPAVGIQTTFWGTVSWSLGAYSGVNQLYTVALNVTPTSGLNTTTMSEVYTITYNANGGTGTVSDSATYVAGDIVALAQGTGLTRTGYVFAGWNTEADGSGTNYGPGEEIMMYKSLILHATWLEASD